MSPATIASRCALAVVLTACGGKVSVDDKQGCAGNDNACHAACENTDSDPENCGSCGNTCDGTCTNGRCLTLFSTNGNTLSFAAFGKTDVFWSGYTGYNASIQVLVKAPLVGGSQTTLVEGGQYFWGIAVDATSVYYGTYGAIM